MCVCVCLEEGNRGGYLRVSLTTFAEIRDFNLCGPGSRWHIFALHFHTPNQSGDRFNSQTE